MLIFFLLKQLEVTISLVILVKTCLPFYNSDVNILRIRCQMNRLFKYQLFFTCNLYILEKRDLFKRSQKICFDI